jgi:hypothetical protein
MDDDAPGALKVAGRRIPAPALALAWWALLATLIHVCFLRDGPRSLDGTARWFAEPRPWLVAIAATLVLAGTLAILRGPRPAGLASTAAGALLITVWALRSTLTGGLS